MNIYLRIFLILIAAIIASGNFWLSPLQAGEYRQHEAHEHGVAHLNVAQDGNNLFMELISPAVNIVSFEHPPHTQEQKAAVRAAVDTLEEGESLFGLSRDAGCGLVKSSVHTDIISDSGHGSESAASHEHDDLSGDAGRDAEINDHGHHQSGD